MSIFNMLLSVFLMLVLTAIAVELKKHNPEPINFKVGDCLVKSLEELEEWEKKPEFKVLKEGKKSYLAKDLFYKYHNITFKIKFEDMWKYKKVECGDKK